MLLYLIGLRLDMNPIRSKKFRDILRLNEKMFRYQHR